MQLGTKILDIWFIFKGPNKNLISDLWKKWPILTPCENPNFKMKLDIEGDMIKFHLLKLLYDSTNIYFWQIVWAPQTCAYMLPWTLCSPQKCLFLFFNFNFKLEFLNIAIIRRSHLFHRSSRILFTTTCLLWPKKSNELVSHTKKLLFETK